MNINDKELIDNKQEINNAETKTDEKEINTEESMKDKKINEIKDEINKSLNEFENLVTKKNKNKNIFIEHLANGHNFIKWMIKKYKLQFGPSPAMVFKNEIFYCRLGVNIGCEQGDEQGQYDKRPVLILQNDKGNSSSTTTIIAPITTHDGTIEEMEFDFNGVKIKKFVIKHEQGIKKLDYYEIPVGLEPGYKKEIKGYINLAQIRTISKKRLEKEPVAKINSTTKNKIDKSIKKLLSMN